MQSIWSIKRMNANGVVISWAYITFVFFFFITANIIETETLRRRKEAEKKKYKDAAYRCNIQPKKLRKNHHYTTGSKNSLSYNYEI